jgi:hypothetical protein
MDKAKFEQPRGGSLAVIVKPSTLTSMPPT